MRYCEDCELVWTEGGECCPHCGKMSKEGEPPMPCVLANPPKRARPADGL